MGKDKGGEPTIALLAHSDNKQTTGIICIETETTLLNMLSALLNGWMRLNHKKGEGKEERVDE